MLITIRQAASSERLVHNARPAPNQVTKHAR
jgi:hypothetical protein